jgi:hypothetical protein
VRLPLSLDGVISYLPVRKPSAEEFRNFHKLNLTYESPIWDPYSTDFSRQEEKFTDSKGALVTRNSAHANIQIVTTRDSTVSMVLSSVSMLLEDKHLIDDESMRDPFGSLDDSSPLSLQFSCIVSVAQSSNYRYKVTPEELAKQWNIGLLTAKRTLLATTQRGVKDIAS